MHAHTCPSLRLAQMPKAGYIYLWTLILICTEICMRVCWSVRFCDYIDDDKRLILNGPVLHKIQLFLWKACHTVLVMHNKASFTFLLYTQPLHTPTYSASILQAQCFRQLIFQMIQMMMMPCIWPIFLVGCHILKIQMALLTPSGGQKWKSLRPPLDWMI